MTASRETIHPQAVMTSPERAPDMLLPSDAALEEIALINLERAAEDGAFAVRWIKRLRDLAASLQGRLSQAEAERDRLRDALAEEACIAETYIRLAYVDPGQNAGRQTWKERAEALKAERDEMERLKNTCATLAHERWEETERIRVERDKLAKLVYVPGLWKCPKCRCAVISQNLHVDTGGFSANNEPQRCPNDCGPMRRVSERDAGNEVCDKLEAAESRIHTLEDVIRTCADRFREYERIHAQKAMPDLDKVRRNAEMAELCQRALTSPFAAEDGRS